VDDWDSSSGWVHIRYRGFRSKEGKSAPREEEGELVVVEPGETAP
jgi:hypothetical protein